ncbi:hypothetical protein LCGC14_1006180 [marine sediment metagenome]|uniref:Uncharacterized protein n=1 Tax=marine sediment metagenome TaxID=412755 RepID=A0A0F9R7P8_9ZZZZ
MRRAGRIHLPELMERCIVSSKLIRIVLDMVGNHFIVEYGERYAPGLTQAQQEEREQLIKDLEGFSDFTAAEKLGDEERRGLVDKKKRLVTLNEMEDVPHIEWHPLEEHLIQSLLIVVQQNMRHTYVENLPAYLLDRILDPKGNVIINVGSPGQTPLEQPPLDLAAVVETHGLPPELAENVGDLQSHTEAELAVIKVIVQDTPGWADLLTVREMPERRLVFVRPNKFLGDFWKPINRALREIYEECWISDGTGDRDAHWQVPT